MELSDSIINNCQQRALGQVLTDWGSLSYNEVIESLEADDQSYPSHPDIMVWQPFEDQWAEFIVEQIQELFLSFRSLALETIEEVKG
jgi:hypothetical protein